MIEKHRSKNEAWLRARAEENDRERRELCSLRVSEHVTSAFFFSFLSISCTAVMYGCSGRHAPT